MQSALEDHAERGDRGEEDPAGHAPQRAPRDDDAGGHARPRGARRPRQALRRAAKDAIFALTKARLVVAEKDGFTFVHDSVLSEWGLVRGWIAGRARRSPARRARRARRRALVRVEGSGGAVAQGPPRRGDRALEARTRAAQRDRAALPDRVARTRRRRRARRASPSQRWSWRLDRRERALLREDQQRRRRCRRAGTRTRSRRRSPR